MNLGDILVTFLLINVDISTYIKPVSGFLVTFYNDL
nr:MAG TPA: hypothetical protein [Caudoviricetes sp.]